MTVNDKTQKFQPGQMLHAVIIGAFRAKGQTLHGWCKENGVSQVSCRNATHGLNGGPAGKELLARMIDGAGRDAVEHLYRERFQAAAERMAS